jgi:catechol 2,3-dioxygenase-like lactoylglutathione lyase family enzyme
MLRRIDRILLRVPGLQSAVKYYRDVMGLKLTREESNLASFRLNDGETELVLHTDEDLPDEAIYYLVDDVRDLYKRREALNLKFSGPPTQVSRGFRATVKDPFGNVLLILDRTTEKATGKHVVEDAKAAGTGSLFAGVPQRRDVKRDALIAGYEKIGRTADDLPYTPHFESLYSGYAAQLGDPKPTRAEVWRHLLNLRKAGKLPKLGPARSKPPEVSDEHRAALRKTLGADIGKRDRLPYTERFDAIVDAFNRTQPRPLSPHLVWRLVATLAK